MYNGIYDEDANEHLPDQRAEEGLGKALGEDWRASRRTSSPRHRCVSDNEEEETEVKKAAIYTRVSETQLYDLREMAKQRGYEIVHEYSDTISGAKAKRPGLDQLMADVRRRRFDVVLVGRSTGLPEVCAIFSKCSTS